MREHRVNAENALGRKLNRGETIVFVNGRKDDPRIENLYVYTTYGEFRRSIHLGIRPVESNLSPMTYMAPNSRGQTIEVQESFRRSPELPVMPSGEWSQERRTWIGKRRRKGVVNTRGVPDTNDAVAG